MLNLAVYIKTIRLWRLSIQLLIGIKIVLIVTMIIILNISNLHVNGPKFCNGITMYFPRQMSDKKIKK